MESGTESGASGSDAIYAEVLFEFHGQEEELQLRHLNVGDRIVVTACPTADGWWYGEVVDADSGTCATGYFPSSFVKLLGGRGGRSPTAVGGVTQAVGPDAPDWWSARDPESKEIYFFNSQTGQLSWDPPTADIIAGGTPGHGEDRTEQVTKDVELPETARPVTAIKFAEALSQATDQHQATGTPLSRTSSKWFMCTDPGTGQDYLYNAVTRRRTWCEQPGSKDAVGKARAPAAAKAGGAFSALRGTRRRQNSAFKGPDSHSGRARSSAREAGAAGMVVGDVVASQHSKAVDHLGADGHAPALTSRPLSYHDDDDPVVWSPVNPMSPSAAAQESVGGVEMRGLGKRYAHLSTDPDGSQIESARFTDSRFSDDRSGHEVAGKPFRRGTTGSFCKLEPTPGGRCCPFKKTAAALILLCVVIVAAIATASLAAAGALPGLLDALGIDVRTETEKLHDLVTLHASCPGDREFLHEVIRASDNKTRSVVLSGTAKMGPNVDLVLELRVPPTSTSAAGDVASTQLYADIKGPISVDIGGGGDVFTFSAQGSYWPTPHLRCDASSVHFMGRAHDPSGFDLDRIPWLTLVNGVAILLVDFGVEMDGGRFKDDPPITEGGEALLAGMTQVGRRRLLRALAGEDPTRVPISKATSTGMGWRPSPKSRHSGEFLSTSGANSVIRGMAIVAQPRINKCTNTSCNKINVRRSRELGLNAVLSVGTRRYTEDFAIAVKDVEFDSVGKGIDTVLQRVGDSHLRSFADRIYPCDGQDRIRADMWVDSEGESQIDVMGRIGDPELNIDPFGVSGRVSGNLAGKSSGDECVGVSLKIPFVSGAANTSDDKLLAQIKLKIRDPGFNETEANRKFCLADNVRMTGSELIMSRGIAVDSGFVVNGNVEVKMRSSAPFNASCAFPRDLNTTANDTVFCDLLHPWNPPEDPATATWFVVVDQMVAFTLDNGCIVDTAINGTAVVNLDGVLATTIPFKALVHANGKDWGVRLTGVRVAGTRAIFSALASLWVKSLSLHAPSPTSGNIVNGTNGALSGDNFSNASWPAPTMAREPIADDYLKPLASGYIKSLANLTFATVAFPNSTMCSTIAATCTVVRQGIQRGVTISVHITLGQNSDATSLFGDNSDQLYHLSAYAPLEEDDPPPSLWLRGQIKMLNLSSSIFVRDASLDIRYTSDRASASFSGTLGARWGGVVSPLSFLFSASGETALRSKMPEGRKGDGLTTLKVHIAGQLSTPGNILSWLRLVQASLTAEATVSMRTRSSTVETFGISGTADIVVPISANGTGPVLPESRGRKIATAQVAFTSRSGLNQRDWHLELLVESHLVSTNMLAELTSVLSGGGAMNALPMLREMKAAKGNVRIVVSTYDDPNAGIMRGVVVKGVVTLQPAVDVGTPMPVFITPSDSVYGIWLHFQTQRYPDLGVRVAVKLESSTDKIPLGGEDVYLRNVKGVAHGVVYVRPFSSGTMWTLAEADLVLGASAAATTTTGAGSNVTAVEGATLPENATTINVDGRLSFIALSGDMVFVNFTEQHSTNLVVATETRHLVMAANGKLRRLAPALENHNSLWTAELDLRLREPLAVTSWATLSSAVGVLRANYIVGNPFSSTLSAAEPIVGVRDRHGHTCNPSVHCGGVVCDDGRCGAVGDWNLCESNVNAPKGEGRSFCPAGHYMCLDKTCTTYGDECDTRGGVKYSNMACPLLAPLPAQDPTGNWTLTKTGMFGQAVVQLDQSADKTQVVGSAYVELNHREQKHLFVVTTSVGSLVDASLVASASEKLESGFQRVLEDTKPQMTRGNLVSDGFQVQVAVSSHDVDHFAAGVTVRTEVMLGDTLRDFIRRHVSFLVVTNSTLASATADVVFPREVTPFQGLAGMFRGPFGQPSIRIKVALRDVFLTPNTQLVALEADVRDFFSRSTVTADVLYGVQHAPSTQAAYLAARVGIPTLVTPVAAAEELYYGSPDEYALLMRLQLDYEHLNSTAANLLFSGSVVGRWRPVQAPWVAVGGCRVGLNVQRRSGRWIALALDLANCRASMTVVAMTGVPDAPTVSYVSVGTANATFEADTGHFRLEVAGQGGGSVPAILSVVLDGRDNPRIPPPVPPGLQFLQGVEIDTNISTVVDTRRASARVTGGCKLVGSPRAGNRTQANVPAPSAPVVERNLLVHVAAAVMDEDPIQAEWTFALEVPLSLSSTGAPNPRSVRFDLGVAIQNIYVAPCVQLKRMVLSASNMTSSSRSIGVGGELVVALSNDTDFLHLGVYGGYEGLVANPPRSRLTISAQLLHVWVPGNSLNYVRVGSGHVIAQLEGSMDSGGYNVTSADLVGSAAVVFPSQAAQQHQVFVHFTAGFRHYYARIESTAMVNLTSIFDPPLGIVYGVTSSLVVLGSANLTIATYTEPAPAREHCDNNFFSASACTIREGFTASVRAEATASSALLSPLASILPPNGPETGTVQVDASIHRSPSGEVRLESLIELRNVSVGSVAVVDAFRAEVRMNSKPLPATFVDVTTSKSNPGASTTDSSTASTTVPPVNGGGGSRLKVGLFDMSWYGQEGGSGTVSAVDAISTLSTIIRHYDLILLQRIRDPKQTFVSMVLDHVNLNLDAQFRLQSGGSIADASEASADTNRGFYGAVVSDRQPSAAESDDKEQVAWFYSRGVLSPIEDIDISDSAAAGVPHLHAVWWNVKREPQYTLATVAGPATADGSAPSATDRYHASAQQLDRMASLWAAAACKNNWSQCAASAGMSEANCMADPATCAGLSSAPTVPTNGTLLLGDFAPKCACLPDGAAFKVAPYEALEAGCDDNDRSSPATAAGTCASNRFIAGQGLVVDKRTEAWDASPAVFDYDVQFGTPTLSSSYPVSVDIICGPPGVSPETATRRGGGADSGDGDGGRTAVPGRTGWSTWDVSGRVRLLDSTTGITRATVNATFILTNKSFLIFGHIESLNLHPFNIPWLTLADISGQATVVRSQGPPCLIALQASAKATAKLGNTSTTGRVLYDCQQEGCQEVYLKLGFMQVTSYGFVAFLQNVLGIETLPSEITEIELPRTGADVSVVWSNYDASDAILAGTKITLVAAVSGKLRSSFASLFPGNTASWDERSRVAVTVFLPRNGSVHDLIISVTLETTTIKITPELHLTGLRLSATNFGRDQGLGFDATIESSMRVGLPGTVGALHLLVKGDLSLSFRGENTTTYGSWALHGRMDGTWQPDFIASSMLTLRDPSVTVHLHTVGAETRLQRLSMASQFFAVDSAPLLIELAKNELNITRFRPTVEIAAASEVTITAYGNAHPFAIAMVGSWDGSAQRFTYSSSLLRRWDVFAAGVLHMYQGNFELVIESERVPGLARPTTKAARFAGSMIGGFRGLPNSTLVMEAHLQAPDLNDACIVLREIPVPSLAAMFNALRVPALARAVLGDGTIAGGLVSVGFATSKDLQCGIGRGLTSKLQLQLNETAVVTRVLQFLNPTLRRTDLDIDIFLPWNLMYKSGGWNDTSAWEQDLSMENAFRGDGHLIRDLEGGSANSSTVAATATREEPLVIGFSLTLHEGTFGLATPAGSGAHVSGLAAKFQLWPGAAALWLSATLTITIEINKTKQPMIFDLEASVRPPSAGAGLFAASAIDFKAGLQRPTELVVDGRPFFEFSSARGWVKYRGTQQWQAELEASATFSLGGVGIATASTLDLYNDGQDVVVSTHAHVRSFEHVVAAVFQQDAGTVARTKLGSYLPDSTHGSEWLAVLSTMDATGVHRGTLNVTKGLLVDCNIYIKKPAHGATRTSSFSGTGAEKKVDTIVRRFLPDLADGKMRMTRVGIFVPVFSDMPTHMKIFLSHSIAQDPTKKPKVFELRQVNVTTAFRSTLQSSMEPTVTVGFMMQVTIPRQKQLYPHFFYFRGIFPGDNGPMDLEGGMVGYWTHPASQDWLALGDIRSAVRAEVHEDGFVVREVAMSGTAFLFPDDPSEVYATGFAGRVRDDGAVSLRVDLFGFSIQNIVRKMLGQNVTTKGRDAENPLDMLDTKSASRISVSICMMAQADPDQDGDKAADGGGVSPTDGGDGASGAGGERGPPSVAVGGPDTGAGGVDATTGASTGAHNGDDDNFVGDVHCTLIGLQLQMRIGVNAGWLPKLLDRLNTNLKNSEFILTLGIPVFDEDDPFDVLLMMENTLQFQLTKNIRTDRFRFKVHMTQWPPSMEILGGILVDFDSNPTLKFSIGAQFSAVGDIAMFGTMKGMWLNAFGWEGFNIGNAAISIGINVAGNVQLGIGCQVDIAGKAVVFHGQAAFPMLNKIMLLGELTGEDKPGGVAIYFREIAKWWCDFMPYGVACVDPSTIPAEWGLLNTKFYMSGQPTIILGKKYPAGFSFETGIKVFGIQARMRMAVLTVNLGWARIPNFAFDIYFNFEELYALVDAELRKVVPGVLQSPSSLSPANWYKILLLHAFDFSKSFFKLNEFAILGFNLRDNALGKPILIRVDFDFWGINNVIDIKISLLDLFSSGLEAVKKAFQVLRNTLFSMPDCLFDGDCFNIAESPCACSNFNEYEHTQGFCEREGAVESCSAVPKFLQDQCNRCKGSCWLFHCYY